nr:reverse transcriptase domain-containing protein [Tanacetum cinerariifolium]
MVFHLVNGVHASCVEMIYEMDFVRYPQFILNYESEPGYIENYNTYPYDSSSFPQQELCCENYGVTHEAYQCQPPQYTVNHPIFNAHNDFLNSQTKLMEQMSSLTSMCEMACQIVQKKQEEKKIKEEQAANARYSNIPVCYDDEDDYNSAITPNEPVDSLSRRDEHLDTVLVTESNEFIKSSVENLVPNPSESEGESECDMPACAAFTTFSNVLFDAELTRITLITNLKEDLKGITTRSGTAYPGPTIPTSSSSLSLVVEHEIEATKDMVHSTNNESTKDVQPLVVPTESPILYSESVISPIIEPVASLVSAPRPNQRPSIPYPSRFQDQKLHNKANDQREKFFQIFKDLNFNISFADALILMPKFGPSIKSLLTNKDKLCELARTPLNEHCSVVLLKKLPEKLGDPGKFLIPCDFPRMAECLALADLDASINLMPLSVWNKLSLPDLSPTCMTLELADHLISCPFRVAEDVFVKVGTFHFPADFVVIDFYADPRVPLILKGYFLKTGRALIDVFEGELTLRMAIEAITFNLDQTSRYSANYNDMMANRIDVIDMTCEECSQKVLGFSDVIANDPTSPEVDQSYLDSKGDILLLEAFLIDDPSLPPPNQGNYLPEVRKKLKICKAKSDKSSIDEPPEVELKDLPPDWSLFTLFNLQINQTMYKYTVEIKIKQKGLKST